MLLLHSLLLRACLSFLLYKSSFLLSINLLLLLIIVIATPVKPRAGLPYSILLMVSRRGWSLLLLTREETETRRSQLTEFSQPSAAQNRLPCAAAFIYPSFVSTAKLPFLNMLHYRSKQAAWRRAVSFRIGFHFFKAYFSSNYHF